MSTPLLEFRGVDVHYGPIQALQNVSLQVNEGETVALLGANGAGKSTLLMSIFGQPRIAGGQILYRGEDVSRKSAHHVAANGIAKRHYFDNSQICSFATYQGTGCNHF